MLIHFTVNIIETKFMDKKQLLDLKDEIDEAKTVVAELTGKKKSLLLQLKEQFNCDSLEMAEKKVETLTQQINRLESQIQEGLKELEQNISEDETKN